MTDHELTTLLMRLGSIRGVTLWLLAAMTAAGLFALAMRTEPRWLGIGLAVVFAAIGIVAGLVTLVAGFLLGLRHT